MAQAAADEKAESAGAAAAAPPAAGGGGASKLVLILTGVNLLATVGMVAVLFMSFQKEKKRTGVDDINAHAGAEHAEAKGGEHGGGHGEAKGGEHGEAKGGEHGGGHGDAKGGHGKKGAVDYGKMITLDQFTVNLSTPGSASPKYVRVNISLEVPTDDAEGEVTSKMPQVRNVIIDLFNSKRPTDLATAEGRDYLKEEIRNALNGFLVNGKVKGVFFTNFALTS